MRSFDGRAPAAGACALWLVALSCSDPGAAGDAGDAGPDGGQTRSCGDELTYESFGGPFFLDWCTGCHSSHLPPGQRQSAPAGVDFDSVEGIQAHRDAITLRVRAGTMPPVGGPSNEDRDRLIAWLDCGAPVATAEFSPPPPPESLMSADPTTLGACATRLGSLPPEILPRCTAETGACVADCVATSSDNDAEEACRDACTDADPTPAVLHEGLPVDCINCGFLQMLGCAAESGCAEETGQLSCCVQQCIQSGDPSCFERDCTGATQAFGYCVAFSAPQCASYTSGPIAQCYAAD